MKKRILHNWGLKLLSLFIAVALWFVIIEFADPQESRTFRGIQVKLVNTELLEQENKAYEVLDNTDTIAVTVLAPKSVIDLLRSTDIVAEADMSKLTEINTIPITYSIQNVDFDVDENSISGNRDVVRLSVEERDAKWVSVYANVIGEVAEGYALGKVEVTAPNVLKVSGPKSIVSQVASVVATIDVGGMSDPVTSYQATPILLDSNGNEINVNDGKTFINICPIDANVVIE